LRGSAPSLPETADLDVLVISLSIVFMTALYPPQEFIFPNHDSSGTRRQQKSEIKNQINQLFAEDS
jgi:hypothetical protein